MGCGVGFFVGWFDGSIEGPIEGESVHGVEAKHSWLAGQSTASPPGHAEEREFKKEYEYYKY